jgi:hypothetical protein
VVETTSGEAAMHTDMWYELILRELSDVDELNERLREAEAVQLPAVEEEAQSLPPERGGGRRRSELER